MSIFFKRQWPLLGIGAVVALVCFYIIRSGGELTGEPILREIISGEGLKLKDIHYMHDNPDEGLKWILDAGEVRFSGDKRSIFFHEFRLRVEPENRPLFELKGEKGDYSRDSGEINLWGDLEGISGNGYKIVTEHMVINEKRGHLGTQELVKIFGPFFSVVGRGLFVDLEKERLRIESDVTTVFNKESLV